MSRSIWGTLGIAATSDKAEIRRAYARALKRTNPEDDAEGFQALRMAYEQAMGMAERRQAAPVRQRKELPAEPKPEAEPKAKSAPDPTLTSREEQAVREAQAAHAAACRRLQEWVAAPGGDPAEGLARLAAVLDSPAMETVGVHVQTEGWLGRLILDHAPRSDALLEAAIPRFGWDQRNRGSSSPLIQALGARHEAVKAFRLWATPRHPQSDAFQALANKPQGLRLWRNRTTLGLPRRVDQLLQDIQAQHPSLLANLDQSALAWWREYRSKPRLGPGWLSFIMVAPALLAVGSVQPFDLLEAGLAYWPMLALCAAIAAGWVFGVLRPRQNWRDRWQWKAPAWLRYGWAGGAIATLIAGATIPGSALATVSVGAAGLLFAYWAMIVGEPDRRTLGPPWQMPQYVSIYSMAFWLLQVFWKPNARLPWLLRVTASFVWLAVFWQFARKVTSDAVWWQVTVALCLAGLAFAAGAQTLAVGWARLQPRIRRGALMGAVGTMGLTWFIWLMCTSVATLDHPGTFLVAAILTMALHLAHRVPAFAQTGGLGVARDVAMRYGWIAWFMFPAPQILSDAPMMVLAGYWVMGGVAVAVAGALFTEYDLRLPGRGRKRPLAWNERIN